MQLAERVEKIAASQSLAMAARAKAMKAAGIDVISMSLGEPDMDTPVAVRRAVYGNATGTLEGDILLWMGD